MAKTEVRGHCPACGAGKRANVRGEFTRNEKGGYNNEISVSTDHRILQCPACDTVYHQTSTTCSEDYEVEVNEFTGESEYVLTEDIKHWPEPSARKRPDWLESLLTVDSDLYQILAEIYTALDSGSRTLPAVGVRTAFDRGSELVGIDPAITFDEKLDALHSGGGIGKTERDALDVMTDAGSASAHRGWRPNPQELNTMLHLLEAFVHRNFVISDDVSKLKNAVPAKQKRRPKKSPSAPDEE